MKRPLDIETCIQASVDKDIADLFSEEDRRSGYAAWMAKWWNSIPDHMKDNDARIHLGLPIPVKTS